MMLLMTLRGAAQSPRVATPERPFPRVRALVVPWVVLVVGLGATALFAKQIVDASSARDQARFQTAVEEGRNALDTHSMRYMLVVKSVGAFFKSSSPVTPAGFASYVDSLGLATDAPAVVGVGFARVVARDSLEQFEQMVQARGVEGFAARPWSDAAQLVVVEYFSPTAGQSSGLLGLDLAQVEGFAEAMERAATEGVPIATGPLEQPHFFNAESGDRAGFAIVAPVFEGPTDPLAAGDERGRLIGFAFAPLSPARLVRETFRGFGPPRFDVAVYDGGEPDPANLLVSTLEEADPAAPAPIRQREQMEVAARPWLVEFEATAHFESSSAQSLGSSVFMIGTAVTLLLFILIHRDTAQRRRSELIRSDLLKRERAARTEAQAAADLLNIAEDAASAGVWEIDVVTNAATWSESLYRLFGVNPEGFQPTSENWVRCIHQEDRGKVREAIRAAIDNHGALNVEYRVPHPELGDRWLLQIGRTFGMTEVGRPARMAGIVLDITARKEWEEHQKLLLAELNHRVKNTLAIVQSIASQTTKHSESLGAFRDSFEGRLRALAKAHGLVTQSHWKSIDLGSLVHLALAPYANERGDNIAIEGPAVALKTSAALALSMILHELSTNAAKYGALSVPSGRTEVRWHLLKNAGSRSVHLTWRESGGPAVKETGRRGFGSQLIERSVEYDLAGTALLDFRSEGLWCELVFPLVTARADDLIREEATVR